MWPQCWRFAMWAADMFTPASHLPTPGQRVLLLWGGGGDLGGRHIVNPEIYRSTYDSLPRSVWTTGPPRLRSRRGPYVLNPRSAEENTVFYSYLAYFVNTLTVNKFPVRVCSCPLCIIHRLSICTGSCYIQGSPGGIRYSYSCGCVTKIREYVFNT